MVGQKGRGLQLHDPRIVDAYVSVLFEQLEYHKVMENLDRLIQISVEEWEDSDQVTYEKLDHLITESMIYAEKFCTKRYSTKYQWSPLLLKAVYAYRYARLRLKTTNGIPVTPKAIQYHQKQAFITDEQHRELDAVEKMVNFLREAKAQMKSYQKKHVELRKEYIEGLAEAQILKRFPTAEEGTDFFNKQKEKQLKALSNRESTRTMHSKIRTALNSNQGGGRTRVDIPDARELLSINGRPYGDPSEPKEWKGPWITITEPDEIGKHIRISNIKQYHQAHDTPFAKEPLRTLFGADGTTSFAQSFLQGTPIPTKYFAQLQPETQRILNALQVPVEYRYDREAIITPSQFISCYKNVDVNTSSSYSTRHVGHYKGILDRPSLVEMHSRMMTLPYKHGFKVERWTDVIDVVLPKDEGSCYIHQNRIIRLVESDFNQSLRILLARPMGHFLEDRQEYPEMQYGSRDGQMSISAVLNKVLSFDIARMLKVTMVSEENDAIGCYDRVMPQKVSLYLQRMGVLVVVLMSVCLNFEDAYHYIKTAHGYSKETYRSTKAVPLYGACQGTTVGPFFWLIIFSLIMEAFDPDLKGMTFYSPCRTIQTARFGDAFVDDTKFGVAMEPGDGSLEITDVIVQNEIQQILTDLTKLSQHYEKLLYASGGALNIRKCHWFLIAWTWVNGKAYLKKASDSPGKLLLTSGASTIPEEVPRIEPSTGYRTLGAYIAGDGNMKKALAIGRQKSIDYAGLLSNSNLNRCEAYFSYILYFYPKISYALPVSTFTEKESNFLQAPAKAAFLPKIGINRHSARMIIHGPACLGGLQLPDVYTDQGVAQLRLLLGHLRRGDETSRLLRVAISVLQQRVGAKSLFFNLPYTKYEGWTEKTWLTSTWKFMHITNLQVQITRIPLPTPQRENDVFLMTEFVYLGFKKRDLELINQCRIFHQVLTLADITDADGTTMDPVYNSKQRHPDRKSPLQWPNQGRPSQQAWRQWKIALHSLTSKGKKQQTLGSWTTRPHQHWYWIVRLSDKALFQNLPEGWERYDPIANLGRTRSESKPWYSKASI